VHIELSWLLPDGRACGRAPDGGLVRVRGAVPGDLVEVGEIPGGRAADAELIRVVTPTETRRDPPCPWSTSCGGCDLDVLQPEAREAALVRMLAQVFRWDGPLPFVRSPRAEGHRARIKLALHEGQLGYSAARSHVHVPVDICRIARPEVRLAHATLAEWLQADPRRATGLGAVELRSDGQRVVFAFESRGSPDRAALAELGDVALDGRRLAGDPTLTLEGLGVRLRASPGSFYQVNLEVNHALAETVRDAILAAGVERALDLYAGIGNLGLPIARAGVPVIAVEAPGPGTEDLRFNSAVVGRTEVVGLKAEKFDPSRTPFDGLVLDPPRAGAPGVLARAARNRPRRIVYVSCFAPNAARDLAELDRYQLTSVTAFDLFPDTHHVEAVLVLDRKR
jgi:23S rRNA (uracil1939-C5)-methyltransferase